MMLWKSHSITGGDEMLIVEGPDGVGKTVLCKKLLERLPDHIYSHFSRPPKVFDQYWGWADRVHPLLVQDRFHLGELVYPKVRGEESQLDPETYRLVDAKIRQAGGFIVLVTAEISLIRARWNDKQMYDREQTVKAAVYFRDLTRECLQVDVDFEFNCNEKVPYVRDDEIDEIVDRYQERSRQVLDILSRRPHRL
jgi:thymidylate kinase